MYGDERGTQTLCAPAINSDIMLITTLSLLLAQAVSASYRAFPLHNWNFTFQNKTYEARIPSTLLSDLLNHSLIKDPFFGNNNLQDRYMQLAAETNYRTTWQSGKEECGKNKRIVFQGLDTYFNLTINGAQQSVKNYNMFIRHQYALPSNITQLDIDLHFINSHGYDQIMQAKENVAFAYAHTRKAAYQYGWDWAPKTVSIGIWKPVRVQCFDGVIENIQLNTVLLNESLGKVLALVQIEGEGTSLKVRSNGKQKKFAIVKRKAKFQLDFQNPKLWWVHTHGKPHLYKIEFILMKDQEELHSKTIHYGLRVIELDQKNGNFMFKLNGRSIYAKGGNYVPPDMFIPRVYNPPSREDWIRGQNYSQVVQSMVRANYNMIRIWGGGQYESDELYELLSSRGIMVFHDFMFSDSTYPVYQSMLNSISQEIQQQLNRTNNYACMALWCGNNQIQQGLLAWGFQGKQQYELLFKNIIPAMVNRFSPNRNYVHSSGLTGTRSLDKGDIHFWLVWAGGQPYEQYENAIGIFNSEFGTQSIPCLHSVRQYISEGERSYNSSQMLAHQKHSNGFNQLLQYIKQNQVLADHQLLFSKQYFNTTVYLSQIQQSYGVGLAIISQRSSRKHTWGTLVWQFNDAWPVTSWSAVDYFGNWKALQYNIKNLYQNIMVGFIPQRKPNKTIDQLKVGVVNDLFQTVQGNFSVMITDLQGKLLFSDSSDGLKIKENQFWMGPSLNVSEKYKDDWVAFGYFVEKNTSNVYRTTFHNRRIFLNSSLLKGSLKVKVINAKQLQLQTDGLVLQLFISHLDFQLKLSQNYIDLRADETYIVESLDQDWDKIKARLTFLDYRSAVLKQQLKIEWLT